MEGLDLSQLQSVLESLTGEQREKVDELIAEELAKPFIPNPGPQTEALHSRADILLYGGAAGGGKTALEVGAYFLNHMSGLILRREAVQLDGLVEFSRQIGEPGLGRHVGGSDNVFKRDDGGRLKFAGLQLKDDWRKHAGNARDYMAFDEAGEFLKEQVFSLIAWNRSVIPGQRCRVILGSNPPRGGDGAWLLEEFAPWISPQNGVRAKPGELLWCIVVKDKTEWVEGPGVYIRGGEEYQARSRTFIPAKLDDNPFLRDTAYRATLQSLPEPLRSQLLYGDFGAGQEDHEWQVIPTKWIEEAQNRWFDRPEEGVPMTSVAVDVSEGGQGDATIIQPRHANWYGRFHQPPDGLELDGPTIAAEIVKVIRDRCRVIVDSGGGYGNDTLTQLAHADIECYGYRGSLASTSRSRDGLYTFTNIRSQVAWQFREALDPTYGSNVALPPDPEMKADLAALRYEVVPFGRNDEAVKLGPKDGKDGLKERLGRSPDKGDTVLMNFASHMPGLRPPKAQSDRKKQKRQEKAVLSRGRK